MKIGFVGLGKLGLPCALAAEAAGHEVHGWDVSSAVSEIIDTKTLPYVEAGAQELLERSQIHFKQPYHLADWADLVFVAVQTPHRPEYRGNHAASRRPARTSTTRRSLRPSARSRAPSSSSSSPRCCPARWTARSSGQGSFLPSGCSTTRSSSRWAPPSPTSATQSSSWLAPTAPTPARSATSTRRSMTGRAVRHDDQDRGVDEGGVQHIHRPEDRVREHDDGTVREDRSRC